MAPTKQLQAVALLNQTYSLINQLQGLGLAVNALASQYNNTGASTFWSAMPTCAQNADGSLGTADATPNAAHPIDTRVVTGLLRAVPANDGMSLVAALQAFQLYFSGGAVPQTARQGLIDQACG